MGPTLFAPQRHRVLDLDVNRPRLRKMLISAHEQNPQDFSELVSLPGIGAATLARTGTSGRNHLRSACFKTRSRPTALDESC